MADEITNNDALPREPIKLSELKNISVDEKNVEVIVEILDWNRVPSQKKDIIQLDVKGNDNFEIDMKLFDDIARELEPKLRSNQIIKFSNFKKVLVKDKFKKYVHSKRDYEFVPEVQPNYEILQQVESIDNETSYFDKFKEYTNCESFHKVLKVKIIKDFIIHRCVEGQYYECKTNAIIMDSDNKKAYLECEAIRCESSVKQEIKQLRSNGLIKESFIYVNNCVVDRDASIFTLNYTDTDSLTKAPEFDYSCNIPFFEPQANQNHDNDR